MRASIFSYLYCLFVFRHSNGCEMLSLFCFSLVTKVIWEGNGTPLQYSCLENPMDGGAWKAAVHGVAEGQTWLSDFTFTFHFNALEKDMATHASVLAWRIPGTGEPGGLPSMGLHRIGHNWSDLAARIFDIFHIFIHSYIIPGKMSIQLVCLLTIFSTVSSSHSGNRMREFLWCSFYENTNPVHPHDLITFQIPYHGG